MFPWHCQLTDLVGVNDTVMMFCERDGLFEFLEADGAYAGRGQEDVRVFSHGGVGIHG